MVKVRLSRAGSKKRPYYHIVVTDKEHPRDGRCLERIGTYDPSKPDSGATVKQERLDYWLSVGAQLSTRSRHVINRWQKARREALAGG